MENSILESSVDIGPRWFQFLKSAYPILMVLSLCWLLISGMIVFLAGGGDYIQLVLNLCFAVVLSIVLLLAMLIGGDRDAYQTLWKRIFFVLPAIVFGLLITNLLILEYHDQKWVNATHEYNESALPFDRQAKQILSELKQEFPNIRSISCNGVDSVMGICINQIVLYVESKPTEEELGSMKKYIVRIAQIKEIETSKSTNSQMAALQGTPIAFGVRYQEGSGIDGTVRVGYICDSAQCVEEADYFSNQTVVSSSSAQENP